MKKRGDRWGRACVTLVHFVRYVTQPRADIPSKTATGGFRLTLQWVLKIMGDVCPCRTAFQRQNAVGCGWYILEKRLDTPRLLEARITRWLA